MNEPRREKKKKNTRQEKKSTIHLLSAAERRATLSTESISRMLISSLWLGINYVGVIFAFKFAEMFLHVGELTKEEEKNKLCRIHHAQNSSILCRHKQKQKKKSLLKLLKYTNL